MGEINQIAKEVVIGSSRDIKRLFLTLTRKSESLVAKILKSPMDTI